MIRNDPDIHRGVFSITALAASTSFANGIAVLVKVPRRVRLRSYRCRCIIARQVVLQAARFCDLWWILGGRFHVPSLENPLALTTAANSIIPFKSGMFSLSHIWNIASMQFNGI